MAVCLDAMAATIIVLVSDLHEDAAMGFGTKEGS